MSPQCQGKTLNGKQCSRTVANGERFCYQHQPSQLAPQPQLDRLQDQLYAQLARLSHAERLKFITGFVAGSIAESEIQGFWEQLKVFVEGLFSPRTQTPAQKDEQQTKRKIELIRPGKTLPNANLQGSDLSEVDLRAVALNKGNLRQIKLRLADLSGADLYATNLTDADLSQAKLSGAILHWSNLNHANLGGANLRGADLREADLRDVDLSGADLRGAYMYGANLNGAHLDDRTILPDGKSYDPMGGMQQLERFTHRPINE